MTKVIASVYQFKIVDPSTMKKRKARTWGTRGAIVGFDIELAGHGEERLAAEEILGEVDLALRRARQVGEVEGRHAKQRARPLGVGRGDDRTRPA